MRVNVKGTRNIVRAALASAAGCLVHTSSAVAYGLHGGTVTEDTPSRGISAAINYVRSKALAEREVRRGISSGLKAVIMNRRTSSGPVTMATGHDCFAWSSTAGCQRYPAAAAASVT